MFGNYVRELKDRQNYRCNCPTLDVYYIQIEKQKGASIMNAPIINEDIWGDTEVIEQSYYTVYVYKYTGMGNEYTYENILADSSEDACQRVARSYSWYRLNPIAAYKQESRVF
jgi:hypothetical protein